MADVVRLSDLQDGVRHRLRLRDAWRENPGELSSLPPAQRAELYRHLDIEAIRARHGHPEAVFLVHPRSTRVVMADGVPRVTSDFGLAFPLFEPSQYGITPENLGTDAGQERLRALYERISASMPSGLVVGRFEPTGEASPDLRAVVVASSFIPELAFSAVGSLRDERRMARGRRLMEGRRRIQDAAVFAVEVLGARVIGLGGMTASVTGMGEDLRSVLASPEDVEIVTGHELTVSRMAGIALDAADRIGVGRVRASVAILGAGSIGTATALALDGHVRRLVLQDAVPGLAQKLADKIRDSRRVRGLSDATRLTVVDRPITDRDWQMPWWEAPEDDPFARLRAADLLLTATSSPHAFVRGHFFHPGLIGVDDAQPPNQTREETEGENGGLLLRVVSRCEPFRSTVNLGLAEEHEFACAVQMLAVALELKKTGERHGHIGPVDHPGMERIALLAAWHGLGGHGFERDGVAVSEADWARLAEVRSRRVASRRERDSVIGRVALKRRQSR